MIEPSIVAMRMPEGRVRQGDPLVAVIDRALGSLLNVHVKHILPGELSLDKPSKVSAIIRVLAKAQSPGGSSSSGIETEADAYRYMEDLRWPEGPVCPHCGNDEKHWFLTPKGADGETRKTRTGSLSARRVWRCAECKRQFSVLTGTVFHGSKVPLKTWLMVTYEMCANKNGISAAEIQRKYKVGNKTAWFMAHRLREGMKVGAPDSMRGTIVADETFIGGKVSRMNKQTRERLTDRRNAPGGLKSATEKTPVVSLINAETGEVRSAVVANVDGTNLRKVMSEQIDMAGSELWTDKGA